MAEDQIHVRLGKIIPCCAARLLAIHQAIVEYLCAAGFQALCDELPIFRQSLPKAGELGPIRLESHAVQADPRLFIFDMTHFAHPLIHPIVLRLWRGK